MIPAMVQGFTRLSVTRFVWFSFLYLAIVAAIPEVAQAQSPRIEDYRVSVWRGKLAPLNLQSHPLARKSPWTFRSPSTVLRAIGRENIGDMLEERHGPSGIYYYEWKNRRLRLVKFTPVGSYPDPDPPVEHPPHSERHAIPIAQHKAR